VDDGFEVIPDRVSAVAQSYDDHEETPLALAFKVDGASAVDTGDPSLDGEIHSALQGFTNGLKQFSENLAHDSIALDKTAQGYLTADMDVGAWLDQIGTSLNGAAGDQTVSNFGIGDRINPS